MLVRILIDNPGHTFSRNIDAKFTSAVKDLLRQGRDMGVQQFLRETLEFMETQRAWDEDLAPLVQMWQKEKGRYNKASSAMVRIGVLQLRQLDAVSANDTVLRRTLKIPHKRNQHSRARTSLVALLVLLILSLGRYPRPRSCPHASLRLEIRPTCSFNSSSRPHRLRSSTTSSSRNSVTGVALPPVSSRIMFIRRTRHPTRIPW